VTTDSPTSQAQDGITNPSEFRDAIRSLKAAIDELPSNPPAFDDRTQRTDDLREEDGDAANSWREIESRLRDRFEQCQVVQAQVDPENPLDSVNVFVCTPTIKQPITSLQVAYHEEGRLSVVSSYYVADDQFPFLLGDTASISKIALTAGEVTAHLTYSALVRAQQDQLPTSSIPIGHTVPSAHQRKREQLEEIAEGLSPLEELVIRLRNRSEWATEGSAWRTEIRTDGGRQECRSDGGDTNHCILCGAVPVQGPTLTYKGWHGNLMFCEPCLKRTKRAIEEDRTVLEVIADDLGE